MIHGHDSFGTWITNDCFTPTKTATVRKLTVSCSRGSYAWKYCKDQKIPVESARSGFFGRFLK